METIAERLFNYLRDVIYDPDKAELDINTLPKEFQKLGSGLLFFVESVMESRDLANALSKGDLSTRLPAPDNEIAAPLKSLHASLKHLTWQTQQIANGDYQQRVEFMGEFSSAFNLMVEQLAERESNLNEKIHQIQKKTASLEQSNLLLSTLMRYVPQQIIVVDRDTHEVLLMNDIAKGEVNSDPGYFEHLMEHMSAQNAIDHDCEIEIAYERERFVRYLMVKTYLLEWNNTNAEVFAISDITATKNKIEELEMYAYQDNLTNLYNRNFGMFTLDNWLLEKRHFILVFADLDSLKYVNDEFGHSEGDLYIKTAATYLKIFSPGTVACRIGGDEFMLLAPGISHDFAQSLMSKVYDNLKNHEYTADKTFSYSISYGIVAVSRENKLTAHEILSMADDRMYTNKRMRKMQRLQNQ